ncbi:MAG: hypothetical protein ACK5QH_08955 [Rubrivivax sp.]|jgi:hypothetical protein
MSITIDQINALTRCIKSQRVLAQRIDAANPGDPWASLMVQEDIELLEQMHAALTRGEQRQEPNQRARLIATTAALDLVQCELTKTDAPDEWRIPACQADDHTRDCIAHLVWSGEAVSWDTPDGYIMVRLQDLTLGSLAS